MLKEGKGRIINFSSIASFFPLKGDSVYSALDIYFYQITSKRSRKIITLNAIKPGFVLTDLTSTLSKEQNNNRIANY